MVEHLLLCALVAISKLSCVTDGLELVFTYDVGNSTHGQSQLTFITLFIFDYSNGFQESLHGYFKC